jgi:LacI family transcriptional regulator
MTTLKTLADRLGLSTATVSRVLNARTSAMVSKATQDRVVALATELGYRPNPAARALVTGRTHTIGLLTFAMHPAFYSQVIQELHDILARDHYRLAIMETPRNVESDADLAKTMAVAVDGLLAFDSPEIVNMLVTQGNQMRIPMVGLGTAPVTGIDAVQVDNSKGTAAILDHWHAAGRRRIAYLGESGDVQRPQRQVYAAHRQAAGLAETYILAENGPPATQRDRARDAVQRHVKGVERPEAIFAANDEGAIGVLRGLHDLGIRVPQETAVAGCDGILEGAYQRPPLTTIQFPLRDVCREAWRMLKLRLAEGSAATPPQTRVFTAKLVLRESA